MRRLLNLGCGKDAAPGWVNVDGSWAAWLAGRRAIRALLERAGSKITEGWPPGIYSHDLRRPLPFPTGHFTGIYASHVLEHMHFVDGQRLLKECYRRFSNTVAGATSADRLNLRLLMCRPASPSVLRRLYEAFYDFHSHKWMYDAGSLAHHLGAAGFREVRVCALHESSLPDIKSVERPDRVQGGEGVCLEAIRN